MSTTSPGLLGAVLAEVFDDVEFGTTEVFMPYLQLRTPTHFLRVTPPDTAQFLAKPITPSFDWVGQVHRYLQRFEPRVSDEFYLQHEGLVVHYLVLALAGEDL